MESLMKFIKDWMLPIAMLTGVLTYKWVGHLSFLMPYLLFTMLLVTFCKISLKDIKFHHSHLWLLMIQLIGSVLIYLLLKPFNPIVAQGGMICMLAPTATAAAVITGMLGGNVGFLTTYVLSCNIAVAVAAPIYFTILGVHPDMPFFFSVLYICQKVFPILIFPLFTALALKKWLPKVHKALSSTPNMAFYLWAFSLTIVTGITVKFLFDQKNNNYNTEIGLAIVSLILCVFQFFIGRKIGRMYGDPTSSGQGLGQKNTILAIWMSQTYLHPLTALAPSGYILWQNIINSYQLWKKNKQK